MNQLDLTTLIVRNLSLGKQQLRRNSPIEWAGDDGEGLSGRITLVYREKSKRIYLARGRLKGLFFFPIHGRAVIVANRVARDQQTHNLHLTLYVKLDNRFLDVMTHVFSPLLSGAVTGRISKFLTATSIASRAIHEDPERIYQIIRNAEELEEERKSQFSSLFLSRAAAGPPGGESNVQPVSAPSGPAPRKTLRKGPLRNRATLISHKGRPSHPARARTHPGPPLPEPPLPGPPCGFPPCPPCTVQRASPGAGWPMSWTWPSR